MLPNTRVFLLALGLAGAASALHAQPRLEPVLKPASELSWQSVPGIGYPTAVVTGNPTAAGPYVAQARFPAGFRVEPHSHPDNRVVVVLSGTMLVGYGEQFDESRMKALPPGSTWTEPANQPHFAWARDGEVVVQVVGSGPSGMTLVKR